MKLSFLSIVKKEDTETESAAAPAVEVYETPEPSQDDAQSKGKHGEDFCCGSCS